MDLDRAVLETLRARDRVSVADLASTVGVSARTVRRALGRLEESDAEIERIPGPGGGVRLVRDGSATLMRLTPDECLALAVALASAKSALSPRVRAAAEALSHRVQRQLSAQSGAEIAHIPDLVSALADCEDPIDPVTLLGLWSAIREQATVRLRYRTPTAAVTERDVDPYGVHEVAAHWYLVAWCHRRQGQRVFRLDRVRLLGRAGSRFDVPAGIDTLAAAHRAVRSPLEEHDCEVWIGAPTESVREWLPPYRATLRDAPGGVVATLRVEQRWADTIALDLLAANVPVEVREGAALRAALRRVADRATHLAQGD